MKDLGREMVGLRHGGDGDLRPDEFWAVKDINFELKRGECLGLIGHNGAGKTTLLRMLNGLIKPDSGRIEMRGRIGALIALGAGFNPILTGRENIFINASVLGFSKREIENRLDETIEFAELSEFIDTPVQNYSSGMTVRLGFAVATMMKPDILILDEILAVGDMRFVLKCFNRIDRLTTDTAVVFVSHNMPQISRIATDLLLMERGRARYQGKDIARGMDHYYSNLEAIPSFEARNGIVCINSIAINDSPVKAKDKPTPISRLDDLRLDFDVSVAPEFRNLEVYLAFYDAEQRGVAEFLDEHDTVIVNKGSNIRIAITIPKINFSKGVYSISLLLQDRDERQILLRAQSVAYFQVQSDKHLWTAFQLNGIVTQH